MGWLFTRARSPGGSQAEGGEGGQRPVSSFYGIRRGALMDEPMASDSSSDDADDEEEDRLREILAMSIRARNEMIESGLLRG